METLWLLFRRKWVKVNGGAEAIRYIETTWLSHRRHSVCRAYFLYVTHFDILCMFVVESLYRYLKTWLGRWKRTYAIIVNAFLCLIVAAFCRFQDILARESKLALVILTGLNMAIRSLLSTICWAGILLVTCNYHEAKSQGRLNASCTGFFRRTMGCPCAHEIAAILWDGGAFYPTDFY